MARNCSFTVCPKLVIDLCKFYLRFVAVIFISAKLTSFSNVLSLSSADLERRTKLPTNDVRTLLQTVSREVYKNPVATGNMALYLGIKNPLLSPL